MQSIKIFSNLCVFLSLFLLSGCLHITEDVKLNEDNSGTYSMKLDMGEVKGMMSMLKPKQATEKEATTTAKTENAIEGFGDLDASNMIKEFSATAEALQKIKGLSSVEPINDTVAYVFGYSFNFDNMDALNKALNFVNKEKFNAQEEQIFKSSPSEIIRSASGDYGDHIRKSITESEKEMDEQTLGFMKMFFQSMSYEQVYHFKNQIKGSSNDLSKLSDDGHTVRIKSLPFSDTYTKPDPTTRIYLK